MDSNLPPENNPPPIPPEAPPASPTPPPLINRPPPVISPVAGRAPRRSGSGWKVFAIILLVLFALSVLLNLRHFARHFVNKSENLTQAGPRLEEVYLKENSSPNKIAVIDVDGVISGELDEHSGFSMVTIIKEELLEAKNDSKVKAVLLKVDSPGGEVLAADEIANAIRDFQKKSGKPVIVSMGSLAASGGYYVSAPCRWIVANELTITGSIGVIMHGFNFRGLLDKVGVRPEVYKSGKFKDMLSGTKEPDEITPEEEAMVQHLIDETFNKFKHVVAMGRKAAHDRNGEEGRMLSEGWEDYADGRILSGTEAKKLGFVDELGDFDTAVDRAEQIADIRSASLVQYQPVFDIANLFHLLGQSEAKPVVKIDLGIEVPKVRAGYLYFLSPTYLH